jgi:hypothetical protein
LKESTYDKYGLGVPRNKLISLTFSHDPETILNWIQLFFDLMILAWNFNYHQFPNRVICTKLLLKLLLLEIIIQHILCFILWNIFSNIIVSINKCQWHYVILILFERIKEAVGSSNPISDILNYKIWNAYNCRISEPWAVNNLNVGLLSALTIRLTALNQTTISPYNLYTVFVHIFEKKTVHEGL